MEQSIKLKANRSKTCTDKLERLTMLRDMLRDCQQDAIKDADEWMTIHGMLKTLGYMITDEMRRLGYMAVYPIVNGCAQGALYEGLKEDCKTYVDTYLKDHPEMRGNIIVLPI